ncbi:hypothetical protein BGZ65_003821, partial [Modicella reniformis]
MPPVLPPPGSVPSGAGAGSGSGFVSGIEAAAASALTLANNIAFRPMTMQPAKCSKLKIRIFFDSTIFQAGGNLFGRMEITATSSRSLKLGEITVELAAYEEITSKEFTATQSDENGFWMAKKGKTTFPFAFQLPLDCPSSLVFAQTASLRYVVTGLVQVYYHGKDESILKSKEAFVVEAWDGYNPDYKLPVRASNSTKLFWGGSGPLVLEAALSEKLHTAGGNLTVEVKVKNNTTRKVQGLRLGVHRRLEMVSNQGNGQEDPGQNIDTVSVSEVVGTQEFKSSSYLFDTGEERTMTVNMIVPGNARAIRGTALFEVTCFVVVSVILGTFSGELSVEIPVKICHPASLTPAPKPKLGENLLPHHYNLVDEDMDLEPDLPTQSNRRVGSNDSFAAPITSGYEAGSNGNQRELPWGADGSDNKQNEYSGIGRQGEWSQDARELSPANSITSIRSLLASPKQKLSKLADKIQRSTSPSSSGHIQHEHRHGSKHLDDPNGQGRRMIAKSPPLGPALPIAYVPAVERVRYTPFQPPPTTKAKEFLKAAAQYQQEMTRSGALSGLGDDNVEFDLDDNKMASAIHQWISKKESEGQYGAAQGMNRGRSISPIQIPGTSPHRRRPVLGRIDTQVGSFTSQYSPTGEGSPQSYDSPVASYTNQTTSRFLHHAHRQPAAPQTEAFGSDPEDCLTDPPLFAKPLPLPSPPPTGPPMRAEATMKASRARSLSPVPVPMQTPESLALAKQAFERVKSIASPVQEHMMDAAAAPAGAGRSATQPGSEVPAPTLPPLRTSNPDIKVPMPMKSPSSSNFGSSPSGLSRLLNNSVDTTQTPRPVRDGSGPRPGHVYDTSNGPPPPHPQFDSSPELRHVPLNRPLPIPAPKPRHLNNNNGSPGSRMGPSSGSRDLGTRSRADPAAQHVPVPIPGGGYSRNPQPTAVTTTSSFSSRHEQPTTTRSSGHLPERERENGGLMRPGTIQQNAYLKPGGAPKGGTKALGQSATTMTTGKAGGATAGAGHGSGFVYPKTARKPVAGVKPAVAAKPKGLVPQSTSPGQVMARPPHANSEHNNNNNNSNNNTTITVMDLKNHVKVDQRPRQHKQGVSPEHGASSLEKPLVSVTAATRAPQVIMESSQMTQVVVGFETQEDDDFMMVSEEVSENELVSGCGEGTLSQQETEEPVLQDSGNDIRAQAIAEATSIRATGAHTGGYVVNTGKLRQVIKDSNSNGSSSSHGNSNSSNGGSSSGQLIQALADGAYNAASAAVSGL